jgi:hypothetical protein
MQDIKSKRKGRATKSKAKVGIVAAVEYDYLNDTQEDF